MTRLSTLLRSFLPRISSALSSQNLGLKLKRSVSGYVLILMTALVPVLLFGTKYLLDLRTLHKVQLEKENGGWYKRCAKEAALAVAKKWNPGLTLFQQRDAMYKIADDVYNSSPLTNDSVVARAIPRLDLSGKITVKNEGGFNPIQMKSSDYQSRILDKSLRTVEYQEEINNYIRGIPEVKKRNLVYPISILFNSFYNFSNRDSALVLKDTVTEYTVIHDNTSYHYPRYLIRVSNNDALRSSGISYAGIPGTPKETINATVEKRKNLDNDKVKIEIENDKIKVTTDGNYVGYAVPAECNVDIVLGIPVNGAANNADNLDNNTPTTGSPYVCNSEYLQEDGLKTPMSQIGQAFYDFVKNNFHYTRGVNIGIIPYCGMVSLPLDRIGAEYATDPSKVWAVDPENFDRTVFPGNQNTYQGYIRPCMLYGLFGGNGDISKFQSHYGVSYSWTNVMVPQGRIEAKSEYGNNLIYYGDVLSTNDPAGNVKNYTEYSYSPKFMRRPTYKIPAFPGRFNFLSMDFESLDGHNYVWCNPYHIVEMQSDLLKITDLLNLFYPFNFSSNGLSNFIFVPFVWANNLFQSWSKDPKYDAVDTTDATPSTMTNETSGRLSAPSKGDKNSGRKKALILVVNKPDWFEPGELTYLGYDNDYSEIPMIESDCIRGDIDYSDTTKYFADGTNYDGTVQGAKKILKLTGFIRNATTGHYECDSGVATLTFPQKYLVKLVVEGKVTWTNAGQQYTPGSNSALSWGNISWDGTKFLTGTNYDGKVITSIDGKTWEPTATNPSVDMIVQPAYGEGTWLLVAYSNSSKPSCTSTDGFNWTEKSTDWGGDITAYGNGGFIHLYGYGNSGGDVYWSKASPLSWKKMGSFSSIQSTYNRALGFCNGRWCAITWNGTFIVSYDNGATWSIESLSGSSPGDITNCHSEWYGVVYGFGRYWAVCRGDNGGYNSRIVFSRDGQIWYKDTALGEVCDTTYPFRGLGFNGTRFVSASYKGHFAYGDCNAKIKFTNITSTPDQCTWNDTEYSVTEKREFFIEPDQISPNTDSDGNYSITFDATNLRLISAEITNRPYERVNGHYVPTESDETHSLNTTYAYVSTKRPLKILFAKCGHMSLSLTPSGGSTMPRVVCYNRPAASGNISLKSGDANVKIDHNQASTITFSSDCFTNCYYGRKAALTLKRGYVSALRLENQKIRFLFGKNYYDNCYYRGYQEDVLWGYPKKPNQPNTCHWASDVGCSVVDMNGIHEHDNYWSMNVMSQEGTNPYIIMKLPPAAGIGNIIAGGISSMTITRVSHNYIKDSGDINVYGQIGTTTLSWDDAKTLFAANSLTDGTTDPITALSYTGDSNCKYIKIYENREAKDKWWNLSNIDFTASGIGTAQNHVVRFENDNGDNIFGLQDSIPSSNSGYIVFPGTGDLTIQISPIHAIIEAENLNRNGWDRAQTGSSDWSTHVFTIDPTKHYYEPYGDSYRIKIRYRGRIRDHEDNGLKSIQFKKIRTPRMSRTVDFSQNVNGKPAYDSNLIVYGDKDVGNLHELSIVWDQNIGNWTTHQLYGRSPNKHGVSGWHHHYKKSMHGDFYFLADDIGTGVSKFMMFDKSTEELGEVSASTLYNIGVNSPGLFRHFLNISNQEKNTSKVRFDIMNIDDGARMQFVFSGLTLPINAALWAGASGDRLHKYQWQSYKNENGDIDSDWNELDATTALKGVTQAACEKLKSEWGDNLRIYLIKYRKQAQYKHLVTGNPVKFNYDYLDSCATGTSAPYMYDITETDPTAAKTKLNEALAAIAADIKKWAKYKEAENVD